MVLTRDGGGRRHLRCFNVSSGSLEIGGRRVLLLLGRGGWTVGFISTDLLLVLIDHQVLEDLL